MTIDVEFETSEITEESPSDDKAETRFKLRPSELHGLSVILKVYAKIPVPTMKINLFDFDNWQVVRTNFAFLLDGYKCSLGADKSGSVTFIISKENLLELSEFIDSEDIHMPYIVECSNGIKLKVSFGDAVGGQELVMITEKRIMQPESQGALFEL